MVAKMRVEFADLNLTYSIGGQISFDVFPKVSPPLPAAIPHVAAGRRSVRVQRAFPARCARTLRLPS
eukprot:scaffold14757_cov111-Isochrysis_galbana.AAC.7